MFLVVLLLIGGCIKYLRLLYTEAVAGIYSLSRQLGERAHLLIGIIKSAIMSIKLLSRLEP